MFVVQSYYENVIQKIAEKEKRLVDIQPEKEYAYHNCGDQWHDNPHYNNLLSEERGLLTTLNELRAQISSMKIIDIISPANFNSVGLCTRVVVNEYDINTDKEQTKEICIMPLGADDVSCGILPYTAPYAAALMGAEIGDVIEIKIPRGNLNITIMKIKGV